MIVGYNERDSAVFRNISVGVSFKESRAVLKQFPVEPLSIEEQLYLQTHLLSLEQAIAAIDKSGRIVFWSRFAETLYGWTREEVLSRYIGEVIKTPIPLDSLFDKLEKNPYHDGWSEKFLLERRDGTTFNALLTAFFAQSNHRTLIGIVAISRNTPEHIQLQKANQLLAEASTLLIDAADYETPLSTLAQLAVPQIADWCAVHLLQPDGSIQQVALAPVEIEEIQNVYNWIKNCLPKNDVVGLLSVLRSGKPKLVSDVASEIWAAEAAIKSYMIVPLVTHPQTFGAITFVAAESGRHFDQMSLALAENLRQSYRYLFGQSSIVP